MRNHEIENEMYKRAVELIETRYPTGWGGAGVVHTSKGNYYTTSPLIPQTRLPQSASSWEPCLKQPSTTKR